MAPPLACGPDPGWPDAPLELLAPPFEAVEEALPDDPPEVPEPDGPAPPGDSGPDCADGNLGGGLLDDPAEPEEPEEPEVPDDPEPPPPDGEGIALVDPPPPEEPRLEPPPLDPPPLLEPPPLEPPLELPLDPPLEPPDCTGKEHAVTNIATRVMTSDARLTQKFMVTLLPDGVVPDPSIRLGYGRAPGVHASQKNSVGRACPEPHHPRDRTRGAIRCRWRSGSPRGPHP